MIAEPDLDRIGAQVTGRAADETLVAELRAAWPGVHFTCCSEDDIPANLEPVRLLGACNLYLVDSSDHCLRLTSDPERATGVVLASVEEE